MRLTQKVYGSVAGHRTPDSGRHWNVRSTMTWLTGFIIYHLAFSNLLAQDLQRPSELPAPLSSRTIAPRFMNLGLADGLSVGWVADMLQDRHGFMWFTTQDGLNRWDGHEMKVFKHQPFDSTSLSSSWLWGMDEDEDGNLWIASRAGLNRMDAISETFSSYRHDPADPASLSSDELNDVLVATDGTIWAGSEEGLNAMSPDKPGVFKRYQHNADDPSSLSNDYVTDLFEDSEGRIWVATEGGLNRLDDRDTGRFSRYLEGTETLGCKSIGPGPQPGEVASILERPQEPGILWVTGYFGLVRLDADTGQYEGFYLENDGTCTGHVKTTQDPLNPGVLWIALGSKGLARFDIRTKTSVVYSSSDDASALASGFTLGVFTDRSGVVWAATPPFGLTRFDPSSVGFANYANVFGSSGTLNGTAVTSVFQSRDGVVWVTTFGSGKAFSFSMIDRSADQIRTFRHDPNDPYSIAPGTVWAAIAEDASGYIWLGSDGGLSRLDRRSGRFRRFTHDPDDPTTLLTGRVAELLVDKTGTLWVGHPNGLSRMDPSQPGTFTHYVPDPNDPNSLRSGLIRCITEDRAGSIWVGVDGGVDRLDPITGNIVQFVHDPNDPSTLSAPRITSILERRSEPGIIWVATYGGGLNRLDAATGVATHFTEKDGLSNNGVYGILEDEQGRLWMSTNRGISRFDPDTGEFRNYGLEVGLQGLEFNSGAYYKGPFGEMFFGGTEGLNSFFPNELDENSTPPQVTLVDLKLFNESVKKTGAVRLDKGLPETDEVVLNHNQRDITLDFVALHYADPGSNEYAYKLDGWNDDWVYVGRKRTASFTNLDPGTYTFHVKAANSDGVWNEQGASIRLVIEPPFWATWWFRAIAFFGFVGLIYGGVRVRVQQLAARARELEGEVTKRTFELKASNEQLEQSHAIVEAINQETSLTRLLTKILEQARVIRGVEKATAMTYYPADDVFRVRASSGWDVEAMKGIHLTKAEAQARYVDQAEEVAEDIFVTKNARGRAGSDQMAEFGEVASFLVLRIRVEGETVAYLVFDNLNDAEAFDQRDVELLKRLREHIQSAFIKTRILDDLHAERANLQEAFDNLRSTQDRLIQSEKMASLGQLTAGIAHEIKNPLNFVNNFSDVTSEIAQDLLSDLEQRADSLPADYVEEARSLLESLTLNTKKIAEHGKRADGIVKNMLEHSKVGDGERSSTDLNDLLDEYVTLAVHGQEARNPDFDVRVERHFDDTVGKVDIVPQDIGRVFMNLLGNAFDALTEHGANGAAPTVTVTTARADGKVEIRVADNGPGIPEKVRAKIFEPFFTTKPTGSGTGLGLSMSYDIVTKGHGGTLEVTSEEGRGATFIVRLPA